MSALSVLAGSPGLAGAGGHTRVLTADSEGAIKIFAIKKSDKETKLDLSCVFVSEREEKRRGITSIYSSGKTASVSVEHVLQSCLKSGNFIS